MLGLGGAETNIKAVITAEDKASGILKGFGDNVSGLGNAVERGLKVAAGGLAAGGAAATAFGVASVKAFTESEDMIAQTNAVLKSTGQAAGVTADQVTKLATALQNTTKFSDEEVRSAENLLLTFTAIGKDIFPQATKTVLDMSTALGQDTKASAIQLGKALQDPILGVTALRRVGVNFSQSQQDVIKNLVETGQKAKAQQLILKELNTEFGGSAEAAGNTFSGSLAKLKNNLNDVQESIGLVIVKALTPLTQKAAAALNSVDWDDVINRTTKAITGMWRELVTLYNRIVPIYQQVANYLQPKFEALWHTLQENLVPTLIRLWHEVLEPLMPVIGTVLVAAIGAVIDVVDALLKAFTPLINFMLDNKVAVLILAGAFAALALAMNFSGIVAAFQASMAVAVASTTASWAAITGIISSPIIVPAFVIAAAIASINSIKQAWNDVLNAEKAAASLGSDAQVRELQKQAAAARAVGDTKKVGQIANAIAALSGGRAGGGPVAFGKSYVVGENGPEIFTPDQSGNITPNNKIGGSGSNAGGVVNVVVNVGLYAGSEQEKRKIALELMKSLQDIASAKSTTVTQMMGGMA